MKGRDGDTGEGCAVPCLEGNVTSLVTTHRCGLVPFARENTEANTGSASSP